MKKQVWIRQELFYEAKQRCAVLEAENAALTSEVASLRINQHRQPAICPNCGRPVFPHDNGGDYNCVVATCLWSGKLQASA